MILAVWTTRAIWLCGVLALLAALGTLFVVIELFVLARSEKEDARRIAIAEAASQAWLRNEGIRKANITRAAEDRARKAGRSPLRPLGVFEIDRSARFEDPRREEFTELSTGDVLIAQSIAESLAGDQEKK